VIAGHAHELSEANGRILGPCTKGKDSATLRTQPFSSIRAPSRAFALKPSFTLALYSEPAIALDTLALAETVTLSRARSEYWRFVGRTVEDVAIELGMNPRSTSKSFAANVVHRAVAEASPLSPEDIEGIGPTVKVPRIDADNHPYEAISFRMFRHLELAEEEWEDSELLSQVEHMVLAPVYGRRKDTPQNECIIREPILWSPTAEEVDLIRREWTMFRNLIREGKADSLPTAASTTAIHVRPHARNAADRDATPEGGSQTKKSFWLNRRFVQRILAA
jgi:DNA mismatch repair protein MutH